MNTTSIISKFFSAFTISFFFALNASAQIPTVGTNGAQNADVNQLPPEVRQLLPQNQGGLQPPAATSNNNTPPMPNGRPNLSGQRPFENRDRQNTAAPEEEDQGPEEFPSSQIPTGKPNQTEERYTPSEVIPVLPPVAKSADIRAVLRTSVGDITIKLDRARAPQTVAHFVALSRGEKEFIDVKTSKRAKRPFYNGLVFHRVVKGYLIQTGCPFGTGRGGAGDIATVKDEINSGMKFSRPGMVAMAPLRDSSGLKNLKDTNSSQFFITLREMPQWDDQFTIFGEVEDGMDVVEKIAGVKVGPTERPIKRIYLVAVDIIEGANR
jgi:peptidyl-prolyl cis-trans isomerase A (cyclophilin A)